MNESDIIRASEIGQYAFCARAWWLQRVKGVAPQNVSALEAGRAGHGAHGRIVLRAERTWRLAFVLFALAAVVAGLFVWVVINPGGAGF